MKEKYLYQNKEHYRLVSIKVFHQQNSHIHCWPLNTFIPLIQTSHTNVEDSTTSL